MSDPQWLKMGLWRQPARTAARGRRIGRTQTGSTAQNEEADKKPSPETHPISIPWPNGNHPKILAGRKNVKS